ncbi:MAG: pseudouridine synthase [Thermodesulfobacteriota bacterium]
MAQLNEDASFKQRLAKVLARAGVASRRGSEDRIREGRVTVNGRVVLEPGTLVDPSADHIKVDGRLLRPSFAPLYILLNKPRGFVSTVRDPQGRPTVLDLIKGVKGRLFPVGRLDFNTEGLLLLTNDGEMAHRLLHPRYGMSRVYLVKVRGIPTKLELASLRRGTRVKGGKTAPAEVTLLRVLKSNAWLRIVLREGRHREVRDMCEAVGHPAIVLRRVAFGPLTLGDLPMGRFRPLTDQEVRGLREVTTSPGDKRNPRDCQKS